PDGLSMSPSGLIAGTPITAQAVSVSFVATDGNGVAAVSPPIAIDIVADAEVVDDPATNVLATTATGNGQVTPGTSDVNPIYCQIATSPAGVDTGDVVFAVPKSLATGSPATPVTCSFDGLTQATTYYYKVYADDAGGTHNSGSPQSFTTVSTVQVTTEGLNDGMVGTPYAQQLTATGGTGAYTWTVAEGTLPAGLSMSNAGLITGTPTVAESVDVSFTATDSLGITDTSPLISLDIAAPSGFAVALDGPATAIAAHSATGNGQIVAGNSMVTLIYCRIATSAGGVDGATAGVFASPSWTSAGGLPVPITCPFTGLTDQTTYYYKVYAVDSMGTHGSGSAQAFVTLNNPANDQTAKVSAPRSIKYKGTTTLLKKTTKTNIGTKVKVAVKLESKKPGKGIKTFKVITNKKTGKVEVQTFGRKIKLLVKYSAPANKGYTPWSEVHHYVVKK
ncbi:MAG: Ig domain-containing protein, partial [Actinomycetes bacterium]